jgi:hypothetical protein
VLFYLTNIVSYDTIALLSLTVSSLILIISILSKIYYFIVHKKNDSKKSKTINSFDYYIKIPEAIKLDSRSSLTIPDVIGMVNSIPKVIIKNNRVS